MLAACVYIHHNIAVIGLSRDRYCLLLHLCTVCGCMHSQWCGQDGVGVQLLLWLFQGIPYVTSLEACGWCCWREVGMPHPPPE